ncbi:MAG: flagellar hook-associated protein FlgK [Alphaproteobacteria bacterium]|nr:flagellar hook-associated protein FlgK [Alphaproteobacteria bacterium]
MTLTLSLNNALSGLRAAESTLATISNNVTNAQTVGYTRKTTPLSNRVYNAVGSGVQTEVVVRKVDEFLRRDIRREGSTQGSTDIRSNYQQRLQDLLGSPSTGGFLNTAVNDLSKALNALASNPEQSGTQGNAVNAAQTLATNIRRLSTGVQQLRTNVDQDIKQSVDLANDALRKIESLNRQITRAFALGQSTAELADQRDLAVSQLSEQMGIQTFVRDSGEMVVYSQRGRVLVDGVAQFLSYRPAGTVAGETTFQPILLGNERLDITQEISTGKLQGLRDLRDRELADVTRQLNTMSRALYDLTWAPPAVATSVAEGTGAAPPTMRLAFAGQINRDDAVGTTYNLGNLTGNLLDNNYVLYDSEGVAYRAQLTFTKTSAAGVSPPTVAATLTSLVRASDGSAATVNPNGAGTPAATGTITPVNPINLGTITVGGASPPAIGAMILQHGSSPPTTLAFQQPETRLLTEISGATRASSAWMDSRTYRLFQFDGTANPYDTTVDFSRSISVNQFFDPNRGGSAGRLRIDGDRVPSVAQRLADAFNPGTQIDTASAPYSSFGATLSSGRYSLQSYAAAMMSSAANNAAQAKSAAGYQEQYVAELNRKAAAIDGVSVDEELSNMVTFQKAYIASAKVLETTSTMFDALLNVAR